MKALIEKDLREQIQWQPHEKQQEILDSSNSEVVIAAGRGFGKTYVCSYEILKALLKGEHVLLVAPTYDLCDRVLEYVDNWIKQSFPPLSKAVSLRPPQTIDFRKLNDPNIPLGRLEARSVESPEGMLGKRFDLVVVDEAARVPRDVWHTYIYPATDKLGSKLIAISTPRSKNYFYEMWMKAKEGGGAFQFASNERPDFPEDKWEHYKNNKPEDIFAQAYKAEFLTDATSVFKRVDGVVDDNVLSDPKPNTSYIMGLDLGRKEDFTVITVIDRTSNEVVYFDRFQKLDWPFQKKKVIEAAKRYNNAQIVIDSNNVGDAMSQDLERLGLFVTPFDLPGGKSQKKKELIENLSLFIENKYITIPNNRTLLDELSAFTWEITPGGRTKYFAPKGLHDDCVMSLAYAVSELNSHPYARKKRKPKNIFEKMDEAEERKKRNNKLDSYI